MNSEVRFTSYFRYSLQKHLSIIILQQFVVIDKCIGYSRMKRGEERFSSFKIIRPKKKVKRTAKLQKRGYMSTYILNRALKNQF